MSEEKTQFKGKYLGVAHKQKSVSVMLPSEMYSIVHSLALRSDFIRKAIAF